MITGEQSWDTIEIICTIPIVLACKEVRWVKAMRWQHLFLCFWMFLSKLQLYNDKFYLFDYYQLALYTDKHTHNPCLLRAPLLTAALCGGAEVTLITRNAQGWQKMMWSWQMLWIHVNSDELIMNIISVQLFNTYYCYCLIKSPNWLLVV